jgi:hypothetical protein
MSDNDLISAKYLVDLCVKNQIAQHEWMVKKGWFMSLEQLQAEWNARPWYQKARINTANWVRAKRVRLGEIVAGREFNDDY